MQEKAVFERVISQCNIINIIIIIIIIIIIRFYSRLRMIKLGIKLSHHLFGIHTVAVKSFRPVRISYK